MLPNAKLAIVTILHTITGSHVLNVPGVLDICGFAS
jgi:hypothetical protein